ncbi:MAG TPA: LacI family DNA-binding transcriptional regulator [Actinospica sp.]|nr:LacI family DNA-binding transcriptional regulator [Actinospica sp.]
MARDRDESSAKAGAAEPAVSGKPDAAMRGVTIAYIAESAGVSAPTVSKVLNGRPGVSDDTRARVEALINRHGYQQRAPIRSNTMELVFRDVADHWGMEIVLGVEQVARHNRVGLMVSAFDAESPLDDIVDRRPDAVLSVARLTSADREQLSARNIAFVVFDPVEALPDDVPFVGATNWRGARSAAQHLIDLGHRRIAMINGPDHVFCRIRRSGYADAMESAGLPVPPELLIATQLTREHGYAAARTLLALPREKRPTAIFTASDVQAVGVYQAAREAGLSIPDDLSVVGFDDLPVAEYLDPPLTTVRQPLAEMAAAATELALALGRGERPAQIGLEIATTFVGRASTAPPRP